MRTRIRIATALAAGALAIPLGMVATATPALAYECRYVTAQDMSTFSASTGSTRLSPFTIYHNQTVRVYERADGRYRVNFDARGTTYFARWISADPAFTNAC
jgi:hypothetical protein